MFGQQLWLEGLAPPARSWRARGDPLFFAVRPDGAAAPQLVELARALSHRYGLTGAITPTGRQHVSLRGCFRPRPEIDAAAKVLTSSVAIEMTAFELRLDRVMSFKSKSSRRPVVAVGLSGELEELRRRLYRAMRRRSRQGPIGATFLPHVTLLRDSAVVPEQPIAPIVWTVRELVLIHSVWGEARHRILGRWQLRG